MAAQPRRFLLWLWVLPALALAPLSCRPAAKAPVPPPPLPRLEGERALKEVADFVALGPRDSGTPGAEKAAGYLERRLRDFGLEVSRQTFTNATPRGPVVFRNVLAEIPGTTEDRIILGSHYDTKSGIPGFVGANDSGSSTGLLLELARLLEDTWPGRPDTPRLVFAFLDGEECQTTYGPRDGLHGSRHLAATLKQQGLAPSVKAVIILDMVGDRDLTIGFPRNSNPHLTDLFFQAAGAESARTRFALASNKVLDDHVPFMKRGMPAIDVIDFHFGSAPGKNDYWHTAEDTLDKLSAESLGVIGNVTLDVLERLCRQP